LQRFTGRLLLTAVDFSISGKKIPDFPISMKDRRTFAVKRDAAFWSPLWLNAPFHPTELAEKTAPPLPVSKYTMSAI
jgi:hypothetical protein